MDSTGWKIYGEGEWKVRQHGISKRRTWRKLHVGVNPEDGEIQAALLTENSVSDDEAVEALLEQIVLVNSPGRRQTFYAMSSFSYQIVRSRRKTISIIVHRDGRVVVRAPLHLSERAIRNLVEGKKDWVASRQAEFARKQIPARRFIPGETFLYQGQSFPLVITDVQRPALRLTTQFELSRSYLSRARQVFERWYRLQAAQVIGERVVLFAAQFNLRYQSVRIGAARTRWGSCSNKGTLNFTWRLVMAPLDVVDYVVVHELAHLLVPNHSAAFWRQVESMLPNYRACRDWLKQHGHTLTLD